MGRSIIAGGSYLPIKEVTLNLAQAAAAYDIVTATGDLIIVDYTIYVTTVGATFDSVSIQTNDTTPQILMTAVEGAVANLTALANIQPANQGKSFRLSNGKKIQFTIAGATGTGAIKIALLYRPITDGAFI